VRAVRKVFSTPRLAEFATRQGLTTRVGLDPEWWPEVALKELIHQEHGDRPADRNPIEQISQSILR
jgi:hypothetical protein